MPPLLSSIVAMALWVLLSSGLFAWSKLEADAQVIAVGAAQAQIVSSAYARYIRDNSAALASIATASTPATIGMNQLLGPYLPSGWQGTTVYQQQWTAQVLQPTAGKLMGMMFTTGAATIPLKALVPLAAQGSSKGILGGFIPYANQGGDSSLQPTVAVGANGAFRQSLVGFASPGPGHLAFMLNVTDAQGDNGYLYRVDMKPNRPDLNAMQTDLSMTDTSGAPHNVTGANSFTLSSGASLQNDQGGSLELGDVPGSSASASPYIDFHKGGVGAQDYNVRIQNTDNQRLTIAAASGTATVDVQGVLKLAAIATPGQACAENGVMAANQDRSGQTNVCLNGKWLPEGGPVLRYGYSTVADGYFVAAPNCPAGAQQLLQLSFQNFTVNTTTVVNGGPATWTGNGWIVNLKDGSGAPLAGSAIAGTYCYYPT